MKGYMANVPFVISLAVRGRSNGPVSITSPSSFWLSAVGAELRGPEGPIFQLVRHLGAGPLLRGIPGEVFITLHK